MTVTTNRPPLTKNGKNPSGAVPKLGRIATIPSKEVADRYIGREISGVKDFELFDLALKKGWNVLLEGDTGAGKTMAALAYAAARGMYFYSTPNNVGIDPSQLFGKYIPDESGQSIGIWQDGPVTDMARHGGVLLLNEVNFLPPRVATSLFSLMDGRRNMALLDHKGEVVQVHRGQGECWCSEENCDDKRLLVIADMNPGYVGTGELNQALRNRFPIQVEWNYDPNVEKSLIRSTTLLQFATKMRKSRKDGDITTPTSTNMLAEFEALVFATNLNLAMSNLVQHYAEDDRSAVQDVLKTMESNFTTSYRDLAPKPEGEKKEATPKSPAKKSDGEGWEFVNSHVIDWLQK